MQRSVTKDFALSFCLKGLPKEDIHAVEDAARAALQTHQALLAHVVATGSEIFIGIKNKDNVMHGFKDTFVFE